MKKITSPSKKINSQFLLELEQIPWSAEVWRKIKGLQHECLYGTQQESKEARDLLEQAGIARFIPAGSTHRKTENPRWREWQPLYVSIIVIIMQYEEAMRPRWKKAKKQTERMKAKYALKEFLSGTPSHPGRKPTSEELLETRKTKSRYASLTNFALSVFAFYHGLPFSYLRKLYFTDKNWIRARQEIRKHMQKGAEERRKPLFLNFSAP